MSFGVGSVSAQPLQAVSFDTVTTASMVFTWIGDKWFGGEPSSTGENAGPGDPEAGEDDEDCPPRLCGQCPKVLPWCS